MEQLKTIKHRNKQEKHRKNSEKQTFSPARVHSYVGRMVVYTVVFKGPSRSFKV